MTPEENIYGLERVVEESIKAALSAREVKAFTTTDTPDFQKDRPRVEVTYTNGAGQQRWKKLPAADDVVESAWKGQVHLDIITGADIAIHSAFRTVVRSAMHNIKPTLNNVEPMQYHKVQFVTDSGTSPKITSQDGVYQTIMLFDIDISVQADAWALLFPE